MFNNINNLQGQTSEIRKSKKKQTDKKSRRKKLNHGTNETESKEVISYFKFCFIEFIIVLTITTSSM
jgi:hypothetical protein